LSEKITIGNAELYCADCAEILPTLEPVDLVLTDPPFGIGFAGQPTLWQRKAGKKPENWDDETATKSTISIVLNLAKFKIIWGGNYYELPPSRGWLAWLKADSPPSMGDFELAWTNIEKTTKAIHYSISATNKERVGHPTQKPIFVMERSICYAPEAKTICDPFMGSGTTGVAAMNLERKFIGIERERKYFDIACERIERAQAQLRLAL
jgi:site-specific DNA-methyltransferase (adenine-specific)/modification methylase